MSDDERYENDLLKDASGNVVDDTRLVSFLYSLMIESVPPGVIQKALCESPAGRVKYSNGFVAEYARYVARRLLDESGA